MGTIGEWIGVLLMASIWAIFLAAKVPLKSETEKNDPSNLLWIGCSLAALAIGMVISFGTMVLLRPLIFLFIPAVGGGVLLYSRPLSRANHPTNPNWTMRWVLAILATGMWLALDKRSVRSPLALITLPALASAMLYSWIVDCKTNRTLQAQGNAANPVSPKLD
jgi:uncharacterized membrane-anchored protein